MNKIICILLLSFFLTGCLQPDRWNDATVELRSSTGDIINTWEHVKIVGINHYSIAFINKVSGLQTTLLLGDNPVIIRYNIKD